MYHSSIRIHDAGSTVTVSGHIESSQGSMTVTNTPPGPWHVRLLVHNSACTRRLWHSHPWQVCLARCGSVAQPCPWGQEGLGKRLNDACEGLRSHKRPGDGTLTLQLLWGMAHPYVGDLTRAIVDTFKDWLPHYNADAPHGEQPSGTVAGGTVKGGGVVYLPSRISRCTRSRPWMSSKHVELRGGPLNWAE